MTESGPTPGGGTRFTVVGGGLAGSLLAILLGKAGHSVEVYERRGDPRQGKSGEGRSINLAISTRGLAALHRAGLDREILATAIPMPGRMMHSSKGEISFQPYGTRAEHVIRSVSRGALSIALIDAAERHPGVRFFFGKKCTGVDLESGTATFQDEETGETVTSSGDAVVGADGAFSTVRLQMQRLDGFNYQQSYLEHGYKELTIPPAPDGKFRLEPNALHIWPRGGHMMIALPNRDGSFTSTCFWPLEGANSFDALKTPQDVTRYFQATFPDAVPLMPTLETDYFQNPTGSLGTIRCSPWHFRDRVLLIGDACHAVVPFYGQGANAAFEDCVVLDECLRQLGSDREKAFARFQELRKRNTDALADLSLANFVEMRDRTASRLFLLGKRLEKDLHRLFPGWFLPLYTMVTFSRLPYAEAVRKARRQWTVVGFGFAAFLTLIAFLLLLGVLRWN